MAIKLIQQLRFIYKNLVLVRTPPNTLRASTSAHLLPLANLTLFVKFA